MAAPSKVKDGVADAQGVGVVQGAALDDDGLAAGGAHVDVDVGAHHLGDLNLAADHASCGGKRDVLGTHAEDDGLWGDLRRAQRLLLRLARHELGAVDVDHV